MDVVLVLLALCAVLLAIRLVRARRRRVPAPPDAGWAPLDRRGRDARGASRPADAGGAVDRDSRTSKSGGNVG